MLDERRFRSEITQEMLLEDELALFKMRQADEEHVRARAPSEARCLRVQKEHVLPSGRRLAFEAKVLKDERIAGSPSDDLKAQVVDCDALLAHFERLRCSRRALLNGTPLLAFGYAGRAVR